MNEEPEDEGLVSLDDLITIGQRVMEMTDRVKPMHAMCPGSEARWGFEVDGVRFEVIVKVGDKR